MRRQDPIRRVLTLDSSVETTQLERALKALDSISRIRILRLLSDRTASVNDIAAALEIPTSTASLHVELLEEAGLIRTELEPASRGLRKVCARLYDKIVLDLPVVEHDREQVIELTSPVGAFVDAQVSPTCGLLSVDGPIGMFDDPASFYEPHRIDSQLIWFHHGWIEYRFPNRLPPGARLESVRVSLEACSEAPLYNLDWPSDITVWVNQVEIGAWTSPSDFGGEPGRLTPEWWTPRNTQYGLLKVWHVNDQGSAVDGIPVSNVAIDQLNISQSPYISVRVGVKPDAEHVGGINIFGRQFGNYPQDIVLLLGYRAERGTIHESWTTSKADQPNGE